LTICDVLTSGLNAADIDYDISVRGFQGGVRDLAAAADIDFEKSHDHFAVCFAKDRRSEQLP
jgi:hypothetical protein